MKLHYSLITSVACTFAFLGTNMMSAQVGINTSTPDSNSILDIVSTTKGVLIPRLDQTQTNSLAALIPADGMLIYNATVKCIQIYKRTSPTAGAFECLGSAGSVDTTDDAWINDNANTQVKLGTLSDGVTTRPNAAAFVARDNGNVGIGLINPAGLLDVNGKIYQNNVQTIYNAGAIGTPNYAGTLILGNGGSAMANGAIRNTGIGTNALNANTSGTNNTATGFNAMAATTTGTFNTAVGSGALSGNTQGARNTVSGAFALASNTTGNENTANGGYALQSNTTGSSNVAVGTFALNSNTDMSNGVAVGYESQRNVMVPSALANNTNTSVGYQSLKGSDTPANNIGNNNTAIGYQALTGYTVANNNVAIGYNSMKATLEGVINTAVGNNSLEKNISGSYNTAIGRYALGNLTTSNYNTALGYQAGYDLTAIDPGLNTFIGYNTGRGIITGANNTILGSNVTGLNAALNNNIVLADGSGNQRIRVLGNGNTGIGTITPQKQLHVNGALQITNELNVGGNASTAGNAGTTGQVLTSAGAGAAPTWSSVSSIADTTNDAWVNDNTNTQVKLGTLSDGSTARPNTAAFVAKDNGDVAIGVASPTSRLSVANSTANDTYLQLADFYAASNTTANNNTGLRFGISNTNKNSGDLRFNYQANSSDSNRIDFGFNGIGAPRMSIQAGGNVGIGETAPSAKLEVNGNVEISTVDNVPQDTVYRNLVWNTTTDRVETTYDSSSKKSSVSLASAASGNIGTPLTATSGAAGYEIKLLIANGCAAGAYNKFIAVGGTAGAWKINYVSGVSQTGTSSGTVSGSGSTVTVTNPVNGCADGGSTTAFNYTINISDAGQLSITNNGNITRVYSIVAEKVID